MRVATRTAIGAARARIHAVFRKRNSMIISRGNPFPKNLSTALNKKLVKRRKMSIRSA